MKTLTHPDQTQSSLLPYLQETENLLAQAATAVSGKAGAAEIVAMPDLGLPHNVRRIHGGFLTGAYYSWQSSVPLVPVDATVNVCGVSVYQLERPLSGEQEFLQRVGKAKEAMAATTPYVWNYDSGNHFVTLAEVREPGQLPEGQYLVLHASTAEFKRQFNGLYPSPGNWYSQDIQVTEGANRRYLRYLSGTKAENFYRTAEMLESYQRERQRICAELIAGPGGLAIEMLSVPHYGMPDQGSVAIGCQWLAESDPTYLLLTRPGAPLYMISASADGQNRVDTEKGVRLLTPHGLGVRATSSFALEVKKDSLQLLDRQYSLDTSLAGEDFIRIRDFDGIPTVKSHLDFCPGEITGTLHPLYSHYRQGTAS
jgi:hypothetical protein